MRLAKYIGVLSRPRNARDEKIAMTAPVFMTPDASASASADASSAAKRYVMQFVLPKSKFPEGAAQAPRALDPEVAVRDVPARTMAARRFSGRMRKEEIEAQTEALKKALRAAGVQLAHGESTVVQYAGYNPPWTPGTDEDERGPGGNFVGSERRPGGGVDDPLRHCSLLFFVTARYCFLHRLLLLFR